MPPPTPVALPRFHPQLSDEQVAQKLEGPLPAILQQIVRPNEVTLKHLEALGVHVHPDAGLTELIPNPAWIPDFAAWKNWTREQAIQHDDETRRRLNNGRISPGSRAYYDRRSEFLLSNDDAFRTIRRLPPLKGGSLVRLGNAYEFYRNLELFTAYWDDTSKPEGDAAAAAANGEHKEEEQEKPGEGGVTMASFYRSHPGTKMPIDYRNNLVTAFLKLVAYDFGCNISAARYEPRLHITSRTATSSRSSYFPSGCIFIFRSPTTREDAKAGIVEGPLAAVTARNVTDFNPDADPLDKEAVVDLARELLAALITAQHRAREGREEKRFGEGAWWCTKPRWGGGPGGPIGREVDQLSSGDETIGDKDAPPPVEGVHVPPPAPAPAPEPASAPSGPSFGRLPFGQGRPAFSRSSLRSRALDSASTRGNGNGDSSGGNGSNSKETGEKSSKRLKKSNPMYDNYRQIRPPSSTWDKKARYQAIGRVRGADYDDIFVVSMLFHHVSLLRVRVPNRLLEVLEGEGDDSRNWGRLEVWRSKWFDLFKPEERVEAMEAVWAMMGWLMRKEEEEEQGKNDVEMTGV